VLAGGSEQRAVRVRPHGAQVQVQLAGAEGFTFDAVRWQDERLYWRQGGVQRSAVCQMQGGQVTLALGATVHQFAELSPFPQNDPALDPRKLRSPVAGTVCAVAVAVGDQVSAGQPLLCVEAMKMEMWLHARASGTVSALHAQIKDSVAAGSVLAEIDITEEAPA
jgi:geranyl-CoA carboxylase alpha subunit